MATPSKPVLSAGPRSSSKARRFAAIFSTLFATFWNGIVWIVFFFAGAMHKFDFCSGAFFLIFATVGVGLIAYAVHSVLSLWNPVIMLEVFPPEPMCGESVELRWKVEGRYDRLTQLTVHLEASESATYRQGTDTKTDTNTFLKLVLAEVSSRRDMPTGRCRFQIRPDAPPTIKLSHNAINWKITFKGEIPMWPDVNDSFDLIVRPAQAPVEGA